MLNHYKLLGRNVREDFINKYKCAYFARKQPSSMQPFRSNRQELLFW